MARRSATPSAAATGSSTSVLTTSTTTTPAAVPAAKPAASSSSSSSSGSGNALQNVVDNLLSHYQKATPQRTKLLDAFMAFLVAVGALQFVYCVLAGNYTTEANKSDFPAVSPERAFADYVVCSLILHFFCVNFIN
ncbi:hypothetical protein SPBR_01030 [Sporothrix brasiliensis 5110]|uniref:Dolichyl-diphosphooligosaccharide--protein glycosyltransferase subunit OST2 n=1 Tax=Sporothrix brasiliensis 5110 TaxID=1398154 RepID=A0A0C2IZG3_9PEZI|nr:uncharacterized protein SPBR_01030 [Sporothrix brasiliensis 5110]KIH90362.1 hypothetical protein SPBR_01030 [Sporothrix brasiliensis 5110]